MPRKTRLIDSPRGGTVALGQHTSMRLLAGSMGAAQTTMPDEPLRVTERFEAPLPDDSAWEAQVRAREAAEGIAAEAAPRYEPGGMTYVPDIPRPMRVAPAPCDLSPLPDAFALDIERKPDGMWKVTASGVHVGLFVADRDLGAALARAPGVLAEIVRLDGVVAKKRGRRA